MITDEKKAVSFYPFLFYKAFCNTTEFASGQNKPNPILASSWFPAVLPLEKKISFDHETTLPLSSGSIKTQTFGRKKALEGKKREIGFAYFSTGKIRTSSVGSP